MPSKVTDLDAVWKDITTEQPLVAGTLYSLQNIGPDAIELREQIATPAADDKGHLVPEHETWGVTGDAATTVWAKSNTDRTSSIIITES